MNHPLKVYYPYGGVHQLLHWWTHNEQHQIALARSASAMQVVANRIISDQGTNLRTYQECEVKALWEIEIVGPPALLIARAIEVKHQAEVEWFVNEICWSMIPLAKNGKPLPPQFTFCQNLTQPGEPFKYLEYDHGECEFTEDGHRNPNTCVAGIKLTMSPEEFYAAYHEAWERKHPEKVHSPKPGSPIPLLSRAEPATDQEPLWIAGPNFGHHSYGVTLSELEPDKFHTGSALFYFRKLRELDIKPYQVQLKAQRAAEKAKEKAIEISREKQRKLEDQQQIEMIYSIFPLVK